MFILFKIALKSEISNKSWTITRSHYLISDYLSSLFKCALLDNSPLPELKTYNESYLNTYTLLLDDYLHKLLSKEHIINTELTYKFLELENHLPSQPNGLPLLKKEFFATSPKFPIMIDALFPSSEKFLFVAAGTNSNSFLGSWLYSVREPLSELTIYNLIENDGVFDLKKIRSLQFYEKISKLRFLPMENNEFNFLFICFEDGSLSVYQTFSHFTFYLGDRLIEFIGKINLHYNRIIDIGIDKNSGYVYSVAEKEREIVVSEFNYQKIITKIKLDYFVKLFKFDSQNKKLILSDSTGSIFFYQISGLTQLVLLQGIYSTEEVNPSLVRQPLDCFCLENERNFLFTSTNCIINFYDFQEKKNFQFEVTKRLTIESLDKKGRILAMKYKPTKGELIVGNSNGVVEFWSHHLNYPVASLKISINVKKILFNKSKKILIVNDDKGNVKIYSLPPKWYSELMRKGETNESIFESSTQNKNNFSLIQEAFSRMSFTSTVRTTLDAEPKKEETNEEENLSRYEDEEDYDSSLDGWEEESNLA